MNSCAEAGCERPIQALKVCSTHYGRIRRARPGIQEGINARQRVTRLRAPDAVLPNEEWRPVVGYEGWYEISVCGRVRRLVANHGTYAGRIIDTPPNIAGYPRAKLVRHGEHQWHFVHRLVAAAFIGPCPSGHEVNHKDKNRKNPRPTNLEYVTRSQNIRHALGQPYSGEIDRILGAQSP